MGDEADQTLIQVPSRVTIVKIWIKRKLLNTKLQKEKLAWEALYWCIWQSSEWVHLDKNLESVELTYSVCVSLKQWGRAHRTYFSCSTAFKLISSAFCFPVNKQFLFPWWQCQHGVTLVVISDSVIDLLLTWHFALSPWAIPNQFLSCLPGWLPKAEGHTAFAKPYLATFSPTNPHLPRELEKRGYHFKVIGFCGGIHWDISINLLK